MAGINFLRRFNDENIEELEYEFPGQGKWELKLPSGNTVVVTELENQFRISGVPQGGGYTGVSFRPEIGVLSVGTPARALSPDLVEWGLDQVMNHDNWFVRVDKSGLSELESEYRAELYQQALDLPDHRHVGLEPRGNQLRIRPAAERSLWIRRADFPFLLGGFIPESSDQKIRQAAYRAVYAAPIGGEKLLAMAERAAQEKAAELQEQADKIRSWRRDSRKLEDIREDRDGWKSEAQNLREEVADLKDKLGKFRGEKQKLKKKLEREQSGSEKIRAIKKLSEILGIDLKTAKQVVDETT